MFHMRLIAQLYAFIAGNLTAKGKEKHTKVATGVFFAQLRFSRTNITKLHPSYFAYSDAFYQRNFVRALRNHHVYFL